LRRVHELTEQIAGLTRTRQRKQRLATGLGVILAVSVSFTLMGVTNMGKQLDAEAVAQISRAELQRRLPDARMQLQAFLEREAPRLVGQSLQSLLDLLPRMRVLLLHGVLDKLDELNEDFERKTVALLANAVQETKAELDLSRPDLGDRQKLVLLVETVAAKFKANVTEATLALYPSYQAEMNRIGAHLDKLQHRDPATLSDEERVHKGIIETLMQLVAASKRK
jgi:hypothetical protein